MTVRPRPADSRAVIVDRLLPAAPASVFRALTEPTLLVQWLGPEGSETEVEMMEVSIGGRLALCVHLPDGSPIRIEGRYLDIDPPGRLVHSWNVVGTDLTTTVTFALEPRGSGTRLVLEQRGFADRDDRQRNDRGWRDLLDRLARLIEDEFRLH